MSVSRGAVDGLSGGPWVWAESAPQGEAGEVDWAMGGLVGVAAGEVVAARGPCFGPIRPVGPAGPVGAALLDLGQAYVAHRGVGAPVDALAGHVATGGAGWLLPVVISRADVSHLVGDTMELAEAVGLSDRGVFACASYAEVAWCLMAGWSAAEAVATAPVVKEWCGEPRLSGDGMVDSLGMGVWALCQPAGLVGVVSALAPLAPGAVVAAVAGLVGLRDGAAAIPQDWTAWRWAAPYRAIAPALVRLRLMLGAAG